VYTIEDIEMKAVETDATIVLADSVYLFDPDNRRSYSGEPSRRLAVSQKCKEIAQNLEVPFIVSVQAGRKKTKERVPDLDSIEWSNAFSQDGDTVFFLECDDLDKELRRSHFYLLKSREGQPAEFFVHRDFQTMNFADRPDVDRPSTNVFEDDEVVEFDES
jgi:replicative DNA helicase